MLSTCEEETVDLTQVGGGVNAFAGFSRGHLSAIDMGVEARFSEVAGADGSVSTSDLFTRRVFFFF